MPSRQHSSASHLAGQPGLIEARPSCDRCRALLVEHSLLVSSIRSLDYQIGTSELQLQSCSSAVDLAYRALKLAMSSLQDQQQKFSDELAHLSNLKQQRNVLIGPDILDDEQPTVASSDGLVRQGPCSESSF